MAKKKKSQPKKSVMARIAQYFRDVRAELRKVSWPGRDKVVASTIVVIIVVLFFTLVVGLLDIVFIQLVKWITFSLGG